VRLATHVFRRGKRTILLDGWAVERGRRWKRSHVLRRLGGEGILGYQRSTLPGLDGGAAGKERNNELLEQRHGRTRTFNRGKKKGAHLGGTKGAGKP